MMTLSDIEFQAILENDSKRIDGDICWQEDEDHSPAVEFRAEIQSDAGWPLFVRGSYNREISTLTYVLILKTTGRVYGLDMGKDHPNPDGTGPVGEKHKHTWKERYRDTWAYKPEDVTAPASDPRKVWAQFCDEAKIVHNGKMMAVPGLQGEIIP